MEVLINVLIALGITVLIFFALVVLVLILPVFYQVNFKTDCSSTDLFASVRILFGIISIDIINNNKRVTIVGIIRFSLDSYEKIDELEDEIKDIENLNEEETNDSKVKCKSLKIALYKFETKIKASIYKMRKLIKNTMEYKYKMELIKKIIEYAQKILDILKPKKSEVKVIFGTGNAAITGKMMGVFAILKTKYKNLNVISDFEKKTLKIDINANGHITLIRIIRLTIQFMYEKSIKELRRVCKKGGRNGKKRK